MMKTLSAALVGVALIAAPAMAQNSNASNKAQQSQVSQKQVNASASGLWQGSKLIGLNVYNSNNEKVGDIKQLMVGKSGQVENVVVAVGGFLGMGERDVSAKFSQLKWSDQPVRSNSASNKTNATTGTDTNKNGNNDSTKRTYPDHAVWNTSKDQLQAMPQFNYDK